MFNAGNLSAQQADDLNRMLQQVAALSRMSVAPPLSLQRSYGQPLLSLDMGALATPPANHIQAGTVNLVDQVLGSETKTISHGHLHIGGAKYSYLGTTISDLETPASTTPLDRLLFSYVGKTDAIGAGAENNWQFNYPTDTAPHAGMVSSVCIEPHGGSIGTTIISCMPNASAAATLMRGGGLSVGFTDYGSFVPGTVGSGGSVPGALLTRPYGGSTGRIVHGLPDENSGVHSWVAAMAPASVGGGGSRTQFAVVNNPDVYLGWRGTVTIGTIKFYFAGGIIYQVDKAGVSQVLGTNV